MYPPRVRAVVAPWLESPEYHKLTGLELAALGVPLCGEDDLAPGLRELGFPKVKRETSCKLPGAEARKKSKKSHHSRR